MSNIFTIILINLEKVGIGIGLFLGAYISNIIMGAWKNVKIDKKAFDWKLIFQSLIKFFVLGIGISLLSIVISVIPLYLTFVGIEIGVETMETIDSMVIIGAFVTATLKYLKDAIVKFNTILNG